MKKTAWVIALVSALAFVLVGCGGSGEGDSTDVGPGNGGEVRIADERIIGEWTGEDGGVEFRADGMIVLADGTEYPFAMPSADRIDIEFPDGPRSYNVTWEGDDRHGVLASDSTTTTPTWYDRK